MRNENRLTTKAQLVRTAAMQNTGVRIELSRRDRLEFVEILLSPPSPNDLLQFAMRRRNEVIGER